MTRSWAVLRRRAGPRPGHVGRAGRPAGARAVRRRRGSLAEPRGAGGLRPARCVRRRCRRESRMVRAAALREHRRQEGRTRGPGVVLRFRRKPDRAVVRRADVAEGRARQVEDGGEHPRCVERNLQAEHRRNRHDQQCRRNRSGLP